MKEQVAAMHGLGVHHPEDPLHWLDRGLFKSTVDAIMDTIEWREIVTVTNNIAEDLITIVALPPAVPPGSLAGGAAGGGVGGFMYRDSEGTWFRWRNTEANRQQMPEDHTVLWNAWRPQDTTEGIGLVGVWEGFRYEGWDTKDALHMTLVGYLNSDHSVTPMVDDILDLAGEGEAEDDDADGDVEQYNVLPQGPEQEVRSWDCASCREPLELTAWKCWCGHAVCEDCKAGWDQYATTRPYPLCTQCRRPGVWNHGRWVDVPGAEAEVAVGTVADGEVAAPGSLAGASGAVESSTLSSSESPDSDDN